MGCTLTTSADYLWQENRLRISLEQFVAKGTTQDKLKKICQRLINELRFVGSIDPDLGHYINADSSRYAERFTHYGFARKTEPDNYLSRLDQSIEFKVFVSGLPETDTESVLYIPSTVCIGPLLSNKVYFEE